MIIFFLTMLQSIYYIYKQEKISLNSIKFNNFKWSTNAVIIFRISAACRVLIFISRE